MRKSKVETQKERKIKELEIKREWITGDIKPRQEHREEERRKLRKKYKKN